MKKIVIMIAATLFTVFSFGQGLKKVDTKEPTTTNYISKDGKFLASLEIYKEYVQIKFYDQTNDVDVTVSITHGEYEGLRDLLTSYDIKDGEFFMLPTKGAVITIRFVEKFNYLQSYIYVESGGRHYKFPLMNRVQYSRLFME